jgi:hypothetical protein
MLSLGEQELKNPKRQHLVTWWTDGAADKLSAGIRPITDQPRFSLPFGLRPRRFRSSINPPDLRIQTKCLVFIVERCSDSDQIL